MICGSFSSDGYKLNAEQVAAMADNTGRLDFHPVSAEGFYGGYFLNNRLPLLSSDFVWHDQASGLLVLFSGRIYNRKEFTGSVSSGNTVPDPELAGRLFLLNGPDFVSGLNGDFAIFISRLKEREAWLYRDHVGIRPLVWFAGDSGLSFSTDIVSFSSYICQGDNPDQYYLSGYFRYIDYRLTPCRKVTKLLPGHYLHFKAGRYKLVKYWHPEKTITDRSSDHNNVLKCLDELIKDAVRIRCDGRYNAGAHASSGLDSSYVATLARREYPRQEVFNGFSWSPSHHKPGSLLQDERKLVIDLCSLNGLTPVFSDMDSDKFREAVFSFQNNFGFWAEYLTIRQAVNAGVNLIFSGWGGDEFVSTSAPSIEADLIRELKLSLFFSRNSIRHPARFIRNVTRYILMPAFRIHDRGTWKALQDDVRYLRAGWKKSDRQAIRQFYFNTSRRSHHLGMLQFYHLQDRCEKWFAMGYRHGVEYTYPLLDRRIIEFMLRIPSSQLCETKKFRPLLRELGAGFLPDSILNNNSKNDPVYQEYIRLLYREAGGRFVKEVKDWKNNPALQFIDHDLLEADVIRYCISGSETGTEAFYRSVVWIKALNEFSKVYSSSSLSQVSV
jgi:asparagine synthase (glutamine-hydrolysing)